MLQFCSTSFLLRDWKKNLLKIIQVGDAEMWNNHQILKDAREDGKDLERKVANTRELLNQETVSSGWLSKLIKTL